MEIAKRAAEAGHREGGRGGKGREKEEEEEEEAGVLLNSEQMCGNNILF